MLWVVTDVDTEFDSLRFNVLTSRHSNPGLEKGVTVLLDLFNRYEIKATFHIQEQRDSNLSVSEKYPRILDQIEKFGYEIGIHIHMKSPNYRDRSVEIGTALSRLNELGYKPVSFRAGWYFTTTSTIKILEKLGIKFDCSPVKNTCIGFMRWYDIPDSPYHPDYNNITRVGFARLLVIPVTNFRLGINWQRGEPWELDLALSGIKILIEKSEEMNEPVIIYLTTHSWKAVHPNGIVNQWIIRRFEEIFKFLSQYDYSSYDVKTAGSKWIDGKYSPYFLCLPDLIGRKFHLLSPRRHLTLCKHFFSRLKALQYRFLRSF